MGQESTFKLTPMVGIISFSGNTETCDIHTETFQCDILKRRILIHNVSLFLDVVTVLSVTLSFGVALSAFIIIMIHLFSHRWGDQCCF